MIPSPPPPAPMAAAEIYAVARSVGFPSTVAVTMTAIALRESAGDPAAFNGNEATGDRSYGLWQINMRDPAVAALVRKATGITDETQLLDAKTNAVAAFALWGGHNRNLEIAWYIDRGDYKTRYEAHLPAAQQAALGI